MKELFKNPELVKKFKLLHYILLSNGMTYVENWSEGCQVFKRSKDFDEFMSICRKARDKHGNSFTYTLIESSDIK